MKYIKHIWLLFILFALVQCKSQKPAITSNVKKMVKGIAMDNTSLLAGADIKVKGTERKTSTDWDGKFEIEVKEGEILIVSYTGIGSIDVRIDSTDFYRVTIPQYEKPKTRREKRWQRKYARDHNGALPEF